MFFKNNNDYLLVLITISRDNRAWQGCVHLGHDIFINRASSFGCSYFNIKLYTLNTNILDLSRRFIALSLDLDSMMDQVWSYRVKLLLVLPDLSHSQYHDQLNFCSHQRFLKVIIIYIIFNF